MKHSTILCLALALLPAAAGAQDAMTAVQVRAQLESEGYTQIDDVEFEKGMWTADARSANGKDVDVRIDPKTGKSYADTRVSKLGEADVRAKLSAAGYSKVDDLKFDDGVWKAEARNASGQKMELQLDPDTGKVVGSERD